MDLKDTAVFSQAQNLPAERTIAMFRQGHVGVYELTALFVMSSLVRVFLSLPEALNQAGHGAGWMIPWLTTVFISPLFYIYYRLLLLYPGKSVAQVLEEIWGPYLGLLFIFAFWVALMVISALTLRQFAETFITVALPHTPISILLLTALAVIAYGSTLGIESISRTALTAIAWVMATLAFILWGVMPYADAHFLLPLWGPGIRPLVRIGAVRSGQFIELFALGAYVTSLRNPKGFAVVGYTTLAVITLTYSASAAMTAMVGSDNGAQFPFPLYVLAREIYFGRFFQRLEAIFIIVWFVVAIVGVLFPFHSAVIIASHGLKLPFYTPLVYPTAIITFVLSLAPRSFAEAQTSDIGGIRRYGLLFWLLIIVSYLVALWRRRMRGQNKDV